MDDLSTTLATIARKERELDDLRRSIASQRAPIQALSSVSIALRCRLLGHDIALLVTEIEEVVRMAALTSLPESAPWLAGLLRVGQEQLPVLDLAARETGVRRALDPEHFIVLMRARGQKIALLVDAIDSLVEVEAEKVHRPSADYPFGSYVFGVCSLPSGTTLLLSPTPLTASKLGFEADR